MGLVESFEIFESVVLFELVGLVESFEIFESVWLFELVWLDNSSLLFKYHSTSILDPSPIASASPFVSVKCPISEYEYEVVKVL